MAVQTKMQSDNGGGLLDWKFFVAQKMNNFRFLSNGTEFQDLFSSLKRELIHSLLGFFFSVLKMENSFPFEKFSRERGRGRGGRVGWWVGGRGEWGFH